MITQSLVDLVLFVVSVIYGLTFYETIELGDTNDISGRIVDSECVCLCFKYKATKLF
jgi:hypothetical protein